MKVAEEIENLIPIFEKYPEVKLVYLFGSRATGKIGPLSDYDFAVYLDEKNAKKRFELRLVLMGKVTKVLKTDNVDLCILNDLHSPGIKYYIVKDGKIIFEREPYKLLIEPRILNDFFDFRQSLIKYNLTKMK
ncbi:MAG: nucleotidyltransferase domain-containing protein [bacterium]